MNRTRWLRALLAPALVASTWAGLSACGGTNSTSRGTSSTPATQAPTPGGTTPSPTRGTQKASTGPAKAAKPVPVENNPPGDIPDNLAFIPYANKPGHYSFTHPEGWARTGHGVRVRFTDKLNGVTAESVSAPQAPTVSSTKASDVPRLRASVPGLPAPRHHRREPARRPGRAHRIPPQLRPGPGDRQGLPRRGGGVRRVQPRAPGPGWTCTDRWARTTSMPTARCRRA